MLEVWDLWFPDAGATGICFARSRVDDQAAGNRLLVHAAPPKLEVTVRDQDGKLLAHGQGLERGQPGPMSYLVRQNATILLEDGWRHRLLGEPLPAALDRMGFLTPAVSLDLVHDLPPEAAGSVAQVLLVEALVGQGHASRVSVRLGPGRRSARRVRVEWQPPAWGHPVAPRVIEGNLRPGSPTST